EIIGSPSPCPLPSGRGTYLSSPKTQAKDTTRGGGYIASHNGKENNGSTARLFAGGRTTDREGTTMSTLIAVGYDDPYKAQEVRLKLLKLQRDYLIDLEDAVVAVKDANGKVKLHQAVNLTAAGAISGGFWGSLIGLMFLNPLLGLAVGA